MVSLRSSLASDYYHSIERESVGSGGQERVGNVQDLSDNPLHLSAMEGASASQMKILALKYGVDYRDVGGRTPLMYAVLGKRPKMCEILLKLKASINAKDLSGLSPLLWATYQSKPEIIHILLK